MAQYDARPKSGSGHPVLADLGRIGVYTFALEQMSRPQVVEAVGRLEALGFGALWVPEARGKEAFTHAATLLSCSSHLKVATGIASIWGRDAMTANAATQTLGEAYPNRFVLGLGVSHPQIVEGLRAQPYQDVLARMAGYLDALDAAVYQAAQPGVSPPRLLAALGPRMLELARDRADGAHTYFVTAEHTRAARKVLGPDRTLAVEIGVTLEAPEAGGIETARAYTSRYLGLANYRRNLSRLGWADEDLKDGGSEQLVHALVAVGDVDAAEDLAASHLDAGADHVCIQILSRDRSNLGLDQLAALSPVIERLG